MDLATLLIKPLPKFDESLYGFIVRVMHENLYNITWFNKLVGSNDQRLRLRKYDVLTINSDTLCKFSELLDLDLIEIKKMNFELIAGRDHALVNAKNQIHTTYVSTEKLRICTECIKNEGYIRKVWDVLSYTACHFHNQLLIDACPTCKSKIVFHPTMKYLCKHCSINLCEILPSYTENILVSQLIYERLHFEIIEINKENPLLRLSLDGLNGVLYLTANSFPENLENHVSIIKRYSISELNDSLNKAFKLYESFPDNYYVFIDNIRKKRRKIHATQSVGMTKDFGEFIRTIYKYYNIEDFNFLRESFEVFLDNHLPDYISSNSKTIDIFKRKYITGFQAVKLLGLKLPTIRGLLIKGVLTGYYEPKNRIYNTILDKSKVLEFKKNMIKGIPNLVKIVGLSPLNVERLIEAKVLIPVISIEGNKSYYVFNREDLDQSINKIDANTLRQDGLDYENLIPFQRAFKILSRHDISITIFITDLFDGRIIPYGLNRDYEGLNRYYFKYEDLDLIYLQNRRVNIKKDEVEKYRKRKRHNGYLGDKSYVKNNDEDREYYSIAEAAKRISVTSYDISHWIDKEYIDALKVRDNLILVEEFYKLYWVVSFLKIERGIENKQISKLLLKANIDPISGPSIDGYSKYLFARKHVDTYLDLYVQENKALD